MLDSLIIPVQNFEESKHFYDQTLKILGYFCYSHSASNAFWKKPLSKVISGFGIEAIPNKQQNTDISFSIMAVTKKEVDLWYAKCMELGAIDKANPSEFYSGGEFPYYGASIIDPNGLIITLYYHHDNDDEGREIVRQLGYMSLNATYLEDEVFKLIKQVSKFSKFEKDIQKFRLADQAHHLRKHLENLYGLTLDYREKNNNWNQIDCVLRAVETIAKKRNEALHSKITSTGKGHIQTVVSKKDPNNISEKDITSKNIEIISKELQALQMSVAFLEPLIRDLNMAIVHNKFVE